MENVINLNRARKIRARAEKERQASENRIRFGRPKSETANLRQEHERADRQLSGHKRED